MQPGWQFVDGHYIGPNPNGEFDNSLPRMCWECGTDIIACFGIVIDVQELLKVLRGEKMTRWPRELCGPCAFCKVSPKGGQHGRTKRTDSSTTNAPAG